MNRGLYSAATGMSVAERWMETISHNLANVSTNAYKKDIIVFNEGLERELRDPSSSREIGKLGAGPKPAGTFTSWQVGTAMATGNDFDLAITTRDGMFAVQTSQGRFYTRDGAFTLNSNRELTTKGGDLVLDVQGQPITLPSGKTVIQPNGQIIVDDQPVGQIGLFQGSFNKKGENLFSAQGNPVLMPEDQVLLQQGFIEGSNVNAIEEMVAMIRLNRAFEMAQKSAQSQDETTQQLIQSLASR